MLQRLGTYLNVPHAHPTDVVTLKGRHRGLRRHVRREEASPALQWHPAISGGCELNVA